MNIDGAVLETTADVALYRVTASSTLTEALATWAPQLEGAVALGWSAERVEVGVFVDGVLIGHDSRPIGHQAWFQGHVFSSEVELRWLARRGGGTAVLVGETDPLPADGWAALPTVTCLRIDGVTSLVWGQADGPSEAGWVRLSAARIGNLAVPAAGVQDGGSVVLVSSEYVARDVHGNAVVIDERLRTLSAQSSIGAQESGDG